MTFQNSQSIGFYANRGDVAASPSLIDSPTNCTRGDSIISSTVADSAPVVPSPLSEATTYTKDIYVEAAASNTRATPQQWSSEISCYGLSATTPAHRTHFLGDHTVRIATDSTRQSSTSPTTATDPSQTATATTLGKRSLDQEEIPQAQPGIWSPLKKRRQNFAPRNIDLSAFSIPSTAAKPDINSPLFFSTSQKLVSRPPTFSGSEAAMLRSVRDANSSDVTTLKLARGTVSSASPARSSSTPTSWTSLDALNLGKNSEAAQSSSGLQLLQGVGVLELLERDDRPTFIVDGANSVNTTPGSPFAIIYINPRLQASDSIRHLISGGLEDTADVDAHNEFDAFKAWVRNARSQADGLDVFLPSFHYGGMDWTCSVLRNRFRFISANRSAASIARTSPEPQLERDVSVESRAHGNTPNNQPYTPSDIVIPDSRDYFGLVGAQVDVEEPGPHSLIGSDVGDPMTFGHNSDLISDSASLPLLQPSYDWTRIPLTEDLPDHIRFARTRDWASTTLGPIEHWSADLRAMANMVMASPHPAAMYWGPEYITIYNEAYVPMAGQKHPQLMGQSYKDAWGEIWSSIAPVFDSAWQSGQATMKNDDRLIVNRYGFDEETFFSWSIVPLVGDDGSVVGLYNPAWEHTQRRVGERRMLTLCEIGEKTSLARDVKSFWSQVQKGLEYNEEDVPFALVFSVLSDDSESSDMSSMHSGSITHLPQLVLEGSIGVPSGHHCLTTPVDLKSNDQGFAQHMRNSMAQHGVPIILSKADGTLAEDIMDGFEFRGQGGCHSAAIFPVQPTTGGESVVGFIIMGLNPRRPFDSDYQLFINLLSRQLATSMASVVLFEEEIRRGQRAARLAALDRQELTKQLHIRTQEVEESELKFTRMAEFAPVGMFIANHMGLINYCNDMWWEISQHRPRSEYNVNSWMDSVNDEDRPALEQVWHRLLNQKVAITHEFRFKSFRENDGEMIANWVMMSVYPEKDDEGGIKGIFGCITSIAQVKLAEHIQKLRREEAVELKRQQERYIDVTSHEIRNPLSAILQCADEIAGTSAKYRSREDYNSEAANLRLALDSCLEAANTITLCANHQKRIVDDVLTLSKLDSQLLLVTPIDVQPLAVVQRVLKMFEGELNANGIQLKFQVKNRYIDMGIDWVKLDPSRLMQVLINLLTNAIKFTHSRPQRSIVVTIDASRDISERTDSEIIFFPSDRPDREDLTDGEEWGHLDKINLHFSVQDSGRGLDPEERKLLFQRFSQATPRTHVQYGGSGLGLFISRILTELQGGQIGVSKNSQKGIGSTFSFYIASRKSQGPTDTHAMAAAPQLTRAPGSSTTIESLKPATSYRSNASDAKPIRVQPAAPPGRRVFNVLIVEDNVVNQRVLNKQLINSGFNTQVLNHGGEALEVLRRSRHWLGQEATSERIQVILMDLEMPTMDGMTCARKIREFEAAGTITTHLPILAVTAYARPEQIEDAKAAGVDDVISKPFRIPDLILKMEEVVAKSGGHT